MTLCLYLFSLLPIVASITNFPIVQTSFGPVRGYEYRATNGFVGEIFKKIPFASPPIGPRRWKKPVPPLRWNYTLDSTFFGAACAQLPLLTEGIAGFSEDCLTLNIYTSRQCRESIRCPVVVYVHGGNALIGGTSSFPDHDLLSNFPSRGVIMVTVAYRLGVFGVMALGDESVLPANLAVHDALEALRFVRNEIGAFGGDADQITIMGHSTGATIVLVLAFSPAINKQNDSPLFTRVIAMSASPIFESEYKQVERSMRLAAHLGCTGSAREIMDCLRPLSTHDILRGALEVSTTYEPLIDVSMAGELLSISNVKELREHQIPTKLLLGTTLTEFGLLRHRKPTTEDIEIVMEQMHVNRILGVQNNMECTKKYVRDWTSGKIEPVYNLMSQSFFINTWLFATEQIRTGGEVFLYQFDYPLHSGHGEDINYVMGSQEHPKDVNEEWISRVYPLYFTNFIKGLTLAPDWKSVDSAVMNYYSINKSTHGVSPHMKYGYHQTLTDYYENMMVFDEFLSKMKIMADPAQYKKFVHSSGDSFNLCRIVFNSTVVCALLFIVFKLRQRISIRHLSDNL